MARKAWEDLSPAYRQRLKRSGINRRAHEAGAPLPGTKNTVLERAKRDPEKYAQFWRSFVQTHKGTASSALIEKAFRHHYRELGDSFYYNRADTEARLAGSSPEVLRITIDSDADRLRRLARPQYRGNPWWYH